MFLLDLDIRLKTASLLDSFEFCVPCPVYCVLCPLFTLQNYNLCYNPFITDVAKAVKIVANCANTPINGCIAV